MFDEIFLNALSCPNCGGEISQKEEDDLFCKECGDGYDVVEGIPILLGDSERTLSELEKRKAERPGWYTGEQVVRTDTGPYRHHLRKRVRYWSSVINRYNFDCPRILDAGCGDGGNLRHLVKLEGAPVLGLDYNLMRLMRCGNNSEDKAYLILGDLLERCFKRDFFDIILCNHMLEHIEDDLGVLRNLFEILKPGGVLILGVPNEGALLWRLHYNVIQPWIMEGTDHVNFYTAGDVKALLSKANLVLKEVKYMGWGVPHIGLDVALRQHKWIDDLFDLGRFICKSQATSLYFICEK